MDPFLGEIRLVGFTKVPQGWAYCDGSLLSIQDYSDLFALLGTTYGGNGTTNFALPDLRGRAPIGFGQGPGLSGYNPGQVGGEESVILTVAGMPAHQHDVYPNASSYEANGVDPTGSVLANNGTLMYSPVESANVKMAPASCDTAGGSQPHDNMQPYIAMNYIIALVGDFPKHS